jgi:4-hydroxy-3-polyprenylbenzoate decarboxylase
MKKIIIGISGASGAIYGIRLLEATQQSTEVETHLVMTEAGVLTIQQETDWRLSAVLKLADQVHDINDIGASIASGSSHMDGMVIAPCSIKSMSMIANSINYNLLIRAADVTLKERRKLILMVRETPLHLGHLKLMVSATENGAIIQPPVPAFYNQPRTLDDIVNHAVGRILDHFDINHTLYEGWKGIRQSKDKPVN